MRRRASAGAVVAVVAGAATALMLGGGSADDGAGDGASSRVGTAEVTRRTLAERVTAEGTIGYAGGETVLARLSGTVTALPRVGETIRRGTRLFGVDGEPTILMYGRVPAYRELSEGVEEGPDVRQLESNLAALGYDPGTVDEEFTYATAAAVSAWQEDAGLDETGEVPLGRVAFLPGPRRVTRIDATLGEALGAGGGGDEAGGPSTPVLETTSTRRIVTVELDPDEQSLARRGGRVKVTLPSGRGAVGRVETIGQSGDEGTGGDEEDGAGGGVEATIVLTGKERIPALDGATVSVVFTDRVRRDVLSVPLTALVATGGGRFAVLARSGGRARRVLVEPGLAADGYVEVSGRGLREGIRVEVPRD